MTYDYIIIGAGAAGLLLADAMGQDDFFKEKIHFTTGQGCKKKPMTVPGVFGKKIVGILSKSYIVVGTIFILVDNNFPNDWLFILIAIK